MEAKSNSASTPLGANPQRRENAIKRSQLAKPSHDWVSWWVSWGSHNHSTFEMGSRWICCGGEPELRCGLGGSVELSRHFSACEWCFLPCLVSWLDNSAHHGGWLYCLLQKSVVRQQVPCSYLPTTLCIDKDAVPRAGYSKNRPHSLTWCVFDLAFSNTTAIFMSPMLSQEKPLALLWFIAPVLCLFSIQGKLLVGVQFPNFWFYIPTGFDGQRSRVWTTSCSTSMAHCLVRIPTLSQAQHCFSPGLERHRPGCILSQHCFSISTILGCLISQVFKLSLPSLCQLFYNHP